MRWRASCQDSSADAGARERPAGAHAKIAGFAHRKPLMDIEHVNSIGTLLADLSARTQQLRGYL
jgi:hypothetical protein